jgi:hypothetical protein
LLVRLFRDVDEVARQIGRRFEEVKQHPAIAFLQAAIEMPFEWQVSARWAADHGATCRAIDNDEVSRRNLDLLVREALAADNLRRLVTDEGSATAIERVIEQELLARRYLRVPDLFHLHFHEEEKKEIEARDNAMAQQIRRLLDGNADTTLVHVCGWEHLIVSDKIATLARQLADLEPKRLLAG